MATVNYSVPEATKERFNVAFAGQNKSAVIAELMERAVLEQALRSQREALYAALAGVQRPVATAAQVRASRRL